MFKLQREAAKLSHPLKDEGYFFFRKEMQPDLIDKKTPFPDNGHLHPCSMVVIASKNSHVGFEQQDRQVSFFIPLNYVQINVFPPPYGSEAERG